MEQHYKLFRIRELADNDESFVAALTEAFLEEVPEEITKLKNAVAEKNYHNAYQAAHKIKPTIDLFELGILDTLIEVQDWGKFQKVEEDVTSQLETIVTAIDNAVKEIKTDFNL